MLCRQRWEILARSACCLASLAKSMSLSLSERLCHKKQGGWYLEHPRFASSLQTHAHAQTHSFVLMWTASTLMACVQRSEDNFLPSFVESGSLCCFCHTAYYLAWISCVSLLLISSASGDQSKPEQSPPERRPLN